MNGIARWGDRACEFISVGVQEDKELFKIMDIVLKRTSGFELAVINFIRKEQESEKPICIFFWVSLKSKHGEKVFLVALDIKQWSGAQLFMQHVVFMLLLQFPKADSPD